MIWILAAAWTVPGFLCSFWISHLERTDYRVSDLLWGLTAGALMGWLMLVICIPWQLYQLRDKVLIRRRPEPELQPFIPVPADVTRRVLSNPTSYSFVRKVK